MTRDCSVTVLSCFPHLPLLCSCSFSPPLQGAHTLRTVSSTTGEHALIVGPPTRVWPCRPVCFLRHIYPFNVHSSCCVIKQLHYLSARQLSSVITSTLHLHYLPHSGTFAPHIISHDSVHATSHVPNHAGLFRNHTGRG